MIRTITIALPSLQDIYVPVDSFSFWYEINTDFLLEYRLHVNESPLFLTYPSLISEL